MLPTGEFQPSDLFLSISIECVKTGNDGFQPQTSKNYMKGLEKNYHFLEMLVQTMRTEQNRRNLLK